MSVCNKCGFTKNDEEYPFENGKRKTVCKECKAGYSRLRYNIKMGKEITHDLLPYLPAIGSTNSEQIRREFFNSVRHRKDIMDHVDMTMAERTEFYPDVIANVQQLAPINNETPTLDKEQTYHKILDSAFELVNGPANTDTLVYVIRLLPMQYFKVGKFTGSRESLYTEYRRIGDPEIVYIHRTAHALAIEQEFHHKMADKAIIRSSFDAKGTKTEAYMCPEYEIMETLIPLVRKDTEMHIEKTIANMRALFI